jgi:transcriptional/translational regulatory protein YebC/TACO1
MEIVLDAGADDLKREGDAFQVTCPPDAFNAVSDALAQAAIEPDTKQLTRISSNTVEISDVEMAKTVLALMDALDDHDDVQSVAANFTIPDEAMAAIGAG